MKFNASRLTGAALALLAVLGAGVFCKYWMSRDAVRELDEEFGAVASNDDIPKSRIALQLHYALDRIESGSASSNDFAAAINCCMILGTRKLAEDLFDRAVRERKADNDVRNEAAQWNLGGSSRGSTRTALPNQGLTIDPNGNNTVEQTNTRLTTNTWDPENRLTGIQWKQKSSSGLSTYTFSGDGLRRTAQEQGAGVSTMIWDGSDYLGEVR